MKDSIKCNYPSWIYILLYLFYNITCCTINTFRYYLSLFFVAFRYKRFKSNEKKRKMNVWITLLQYCYNKLKNWHNQFKYIYIYKYIDNFNLVLLCKLIFFNVLNNHILYSSMLLQSAIIYYYIIYFLCICIPYIIYT